MKGHTLQQLDSIIPAKGQTAWSSVILGKVDDKLLTLQVTLPADNRAAGADRSRKHHQHHHPVITGLVRWPSGSLTGGRFSRQPNSSAAITSPAAAR